MTFSEFLKKYQKEPVEEYGAYTGAENPMASVQIHTYNHRPFIAQCIDSVLSQQTSFDVEICIGDDESDDGTTEICKKYADQYPDRIRLFLNKRANNIRISDKPTGRFNNIYTKNMARGKYLAFVEGDDYWQDPLKLQKQVDFLENNPEYVIAYHDAVVCNTNGKALNIEYWPEKYKKDCSAYHLMAGFWPMTMTICFRLIQDQDIPEEYLQVLNGDRFVTAMMGLYGAGKYMPEIEPAAYRVHENSMWSSKSAFEQNYYNALTLSYLAKYFSRIGKRDVAAIHAKSAKLLLQVVSKELKQ